MNDPYQILGISRDATKARIKKAYRRLVMKWHPDKNPGDPEAEIRFKEIQQAYEYLTEEKTLPNQDMQNAGSEAFFTAMQDQSLHFLREMVVKYYEERNWFRNKPGKSKK
jgi:molecular chaperone DnaJ